METTTLKKSPRKFVAAIDTKPGVFPRNDCVVLVRKEPPKVTPGGIALPDSHHGVAGYEVVGVDTRKVKDLTVGDLVLVNGQPSEVSLNGYPKFTIVRENDILAKVVK